MVHEETIELKDGLGINGFIGFVEWILMCRGISSGKVFDPENKELRSNLNFMDDLQMVFDSEPVNGIALVLGSSFILGKESYVLRCSPNRKDPENGRRALGANVAQTLNAADLRGISRGAGVHLLIRVSRHSEGIRSKATGFSVVDEDARMFDNRETTFKWRTSTSSILSDQEEIEEYCWVLWTRGRLRF